MRIKNTIFVVAVVLLMMAGCAKKSELMLLKEEIDRNISSVQDTLPQEVFTKINTDHNSVDIYLVDSNINNLKDLAKEDETIRKIWSGVAKELLSISSNSALIPEKKELKVRFVMVDKNAKEEALMIAEDGMLIEDVLGKERTLQDIVSTEQLVAETLDDFAKMIEEVLKNNLVEGMDVKVVAQDNQLILYYYFEELRSLANEAMENPSNQHPWQSLVQSEKENAKNLYQNLTEKNMKEVFGEFSLHQYIIDKTEDKTLLHFADGELVYDFVASNGQPEK